MAKNVVVAVFDNAAQVFHPPQFFRAPGAAMRWFEDLVKNPEAKEISAHRDHFELHHLCNFDDFSGVFDTSEPPVVLVRGSSFVDH